MIFIKTIITFSFYKNSWNDCFIFNWIHAACGINYFTADIQ